MVWQSLTRTPEIATHQSEHATVPHEHNGKPTGVAVAHCMIWYQIICGISVEVDSSEC